jgi:hypothetical protein
MPGLASLLSFDLATLLGPGWVIDSSEVVTVANQTSMASDLLDVCELKKLAVEIPSSWGGASTYAPPLGWTVYHVSRPSGSSFEQLSLRNIIWVSPQGIAYSTSDCSKYVIGNGEVVAESQPTSNNTNTLILLGGLGLLAWIAFKQ